MDRIEPSTPAARAVRATVECVLDDAVEAARRLSAAADPEALHDVRVALRRLRVLLRAYEPELRRAVPRWLIKDVAGLAARTGAARDAEVFHAWLAPRVRRVPRAHQPLARWLLDWVAARRDTSYRTLRRVVPRDLAMIEPLLRAGLRYRPRRGAALRGGGPPFRTLTARLAARRLDDLLGALRKIRGPGDAEVAHRARIAAKKLRYILEPALTSRSRGLLRGIKRLQDALGAFNDLDCACSQIARAGRARLPAGEALTRRRKAGLAWLVALAGRERAALFRRIRRDWLLGPQKRLAKARGWVRRSARAGNLA